VIPSTCGNGLGSVRRGGVEGFEQSAQIVEAFMGGQGDDVVELLAKIAETIRDRAIDN